MIKLEAKHVRGAMHSGRKSGEKMSDTLESSQVEPAFAADCPADGPAGAAAAFAVRILPAVRNGGRGDSRPSCQIDREFAV